MNDVRTVQKFFLPDISIGSYADVLATLESD